MIEFDLAWGGGCGSGGIIATYFLVFAVVGWI